MSKTQSDGLSQLQSQSRIPARTWRQWCMVLGVDPQDAVEVWEEICQPIFIVTRKIPEIAYILEMRAARLDLDICHFKDEVPKILHTLTFLYSLKDARLPKGKIKSSLLQFYKRAVVDAPLHEHTYAFVEHFLTAICSAVLVAKVLPGTSINLSGVLKPVIEKRGNIEQIVGLGLKSLGNASYADAVKGCLLGYDANDDEPDAEEGVVSDDKFGEDDEDDAEDEDDDRFDDFLTRFKNALQKIYETEAEEVEEGEECSENADALLARRLKAVAFYQPKRANIPSLEEAQAIAIRLEAAQNAGKPGKISSGRSSGGAALSSLGGSGEGGTVGGVGAGTASKAGAVADAVGATAGMSPPEMASANIKSQGGAKKTGNRSGFIETGDVDSVVDVSAADLVETAETSLPEMSDRAREIARLLSSIKSSDQEIWSVFLEPGTDFKDIGATARTITNSTTGTNKAYSVIKKIAQYHSVSQLLHGQHQRMVKNRNFSIEVTGFVNSVANSNKTYEAGDGVLVPLVKIVDHAAVTLVRLEALKTNYNFAEEHPDEYSAELVTRYYEEALLSITDQVNEGDLLGLARQKADTDTLSMFEQFQAQKFADQLIKTCRSYLVGLPSEVHIKTLAGLKEVFMASPLKFEDLDPPSTPPGQIPAEMLMPTGYGDIFDAAYKYLASQSWEMLSSIHKPDEVMANLKTMMCEVLVGSLVFEGENLRHQEQPSSAMSVVSLAKMSENPNLRDFYVRVKDDGQLATIEGFEDGSFVDLFELRECKPSRMLGGDKKKADVEEAEELQTGRKFLFTVGRTNKLFCGSPRELVNGCIRADEGGPEVFPVFK